MTRILRIVFMKMLLLGSIAALCYPLFPGQAKANVTCGLTSECIAFGSSSIATGAVSYTCTNYNSINTTPVNFTLCVGIGNPSYPGTPSQPIMRNTGNNSTLNFNLYTDPSITRVWTTSTPITTNVTILSSGNGTGVRSSGSLAFYGMIPPGQNAPIGTYSAQFYNTTLGVLVSGICQARQGSGNSEISGQQFTLDVKATIANDCKIAAGNTADMGSVPASTNHLTGSTTVNVTCPNGTAFYIGLSPSNGNTVGAGVLSGSGSNLDKPPYQLHSLSGNGPVWGNTATSTSVGNGVAGTGTGAPQSFRVYISIPSINFTPDTYVDTVTVNLNF
jgi:spore coat protein U-like protein